MCSIVLVNFGRVDYMRLRDLPLFLRCVTELELLELPANVRISCEFLAQLPHSLVRAWSKGRSEDWCDKLLSMWA